MPFWWKRYEPLLEAKPVEGVEAVRDLLAKELVELLEEFPPPDDAVEWEDPALQKKLGGRMSEMPKVDIALAEVVLKIVALDLAHEIDAVDHLLRNDHHRQATPTQNHVDAMHLLWRGIVEHLYARKEEARGILKNKDLVDVVERARVRFVQRMRSAGFN